VNNIPRSNTVTDAKQKYKTTEFVSHNQEYQGLHGDKTCRIFAL